MLYLVPTPIGNLKDITIRAIEVLKRVDLILAEDTRNTGILLKYYEIDTPMKSHHSHNEHNSVDYLIDQLSIGQSLALVSDAGTPGISDPGFLLVRSAIVADIKIECLPGPTAFVPALVASGLPSDKFFFEGFLPHKKGRVTRLKYLAQLPHTWIVYESPHRIVKLLSQIVEYCGPERETSIARELSKLHETYYRGPAKNLLDEFEMNPKVKGEIVVIVAGLNE